MKGISRPILWEIVRYRHELVFSLELTSKAMTAKFAGDLSFFYYFMEEHCRDTWVRETRSSYQDCKKRLRSYIRDQTKVVLCIHEQSVLYMYDVVEKSFTAYTLELPEAFN
jgi:hypothetical protein